MLVYVCATTLQKGRLTAFRRQGARSSDNTAGFCLAVAVVSEKVFIDRLLTDTVLSASTAPGIQSNVDGKVDTLGNRIFLDKLLFVHHIDWPWNEMRVRRSQR